MNKEELKELLKGRFEECTKEEATYITDYNYLRNNCIKFKDKQGNIIYFKPVEKFPIIFNGDNFQFRIEEFDNSFTIKIKGNNDYYRYFTEADIKANKDALKKLEELRQC